MGPGCGCPAAALATIDGLLADLAAQDMLNGADAAIVRGRMAPAATLAEALADAAWAQENAPEDLAIKRALWRDLDALAGPGTILASSTSAIVPSRFTEGLAGRARCLTCHPINPPYLIPAVELVPSPWTAADTMARAEAVMRGLGQAPIVMQRELDGFVMNRMQGALLEEAFRLVADGYCTTADVDTGLKDGLALRWSFMGPFETIDLNAPGGVRDYATLPTDLRAPVPLDAAPRLVGAGDRAGRAGAPGAAAGGPAGAPPLARPKADGVAAA